MPCNKNNSNHHKSSRITFTKSSTSDALDPKNQDCITKNLALSRLSIDLTTADNNILFNPKKEAIADIDLTTSPLNTLWTIGSWSDISCRLNKVDWVVFNNLQYFINDLTDLAGKTVILYSTLDKKYYEIKFIQWGSTANGSVEVIYKRSRCSLPVDKKCRHFVPTQYVVTS